MGMIGLGISNTGPGSIPTSRAPSGSPRSIYQVYKKGSPDFTKDEKLLVEFATTPVLRNRINTLSEEQISNIRSSALIKTLDKIGDIVRDNYSEVRSTLKLIATNESEISSLNLERSAIMTSIKNGTSDLRTALNRINDIDTDTKVLESRNAGLKASIAENFEALERVELNIEILLEAGLRINDLDPLPISPPKLVFSGNNMGWLQKTFPGSEYSFGMMGQPPRAPKKENLTNRLSKIMLDLAEMSEISLEPMKLLLQIVSEDLYGNVFGNTKDTLKILEYISETNNLDQKDDVEELFETALKNASQDLIANAYENETSSDLVDNLVKNEHWASLKLFLETTGMEVAKEVYDRMITGIINEAILDNNMELLTETLDSYIGDTDEFVTNIIITGYARVLGDERIQDIIDFVMDTYGYEYGGKLFDTMAIALDNNNTDMFNTIYDNMTNLDQMRFRLDLQDAIDSKDIRNPTTILSESDDTYKAWEESEDNGVIFGGEGDDTIFAVAHGSEVKFSDDGIVTLDWDAASEIKTVTIFGDAGNDTIYGHLFDKSYLSGGDGNDILQAYSTKGNTLLGGDGDDVLSGGTGDDIFYGGDGSDILYSSNGGSDTFIFKQGDTGVDSISGSFETGTDIIDISDFLQDFDSTQDAIDNFIMVTQTSYKLTGGIWENLKVNTLSIDATGTGKNFQEITTFATWNSSLKDILESLDTGDKVSTRDVVDAFIAPGDFNGDGKVDGSDFLAMQRSGTSDMNAWEQGYGSETVM